jgi:hypothetical protein
MNEQSNIDRLFKSKLQDRTFIFDERAWASVEEKLDRHDKRAAVWRKGGAGLLSIAMIIGMAYWVMDTTDKPIYQTSPPLITIAESFSQPFPFSQAVSKGESERNKNRNQTTEFNEAEVGTVSMNEEVYKSKAGQTGLSRSTEKEEHNQPIVVHDVRVGRNSIKNKPTSMANATEEAVAFSEQLSREIEEEVESKFNATPIEPHDENGGSFQQQNKHKEGGSMLVTSNSSAVGVFPRSIGIRNATPMATIDALTSHGLRKMIRRQPSPNAFDQQKLLLPSIHSFVMEPIKMRSQFLFGWGVIAGAGAGNNLSQEEGGRAASTKVVFAGVRYAKPLVGNWSLHANVLYRRVSELASRLEFQSQTFDFGYSNVRTVIDSRTLHYLAVPVYVNYYTGGLFNLYGGLEYDYLFNVKSIVTTHRENTFEQTSSKRNEYGYRSHFKTHQFAAVAGVEYLLTERLSAGIRLNYGLTSLNNRSYFSDVESRITDWKITLQYTLKSTRR